jgi:glycosyltransferase involved in cell wall biosynthesis
MKARIAIITKGRFWFYDLIREIENKDLKIQLISTLPHFVAKKYGVAHSKVCSKIFVECVERLWKYLPNFLTKTINPQYFILDFFGKQAARSLDACDILICGSSTALDAIYKARQMGVKKVILERGSTHIQYQYEILREEFAKFDITEHIIHPRIIVKELREYELADYIVVPSSFNKDTYLERGVPSCKVLVNPFGVNLESFYPQAKSQQLKDDESFVVIHCGALSVRKGVHYLMQAFTKAQIPNSKLLLIGSLSKEFEKIFKTLKMPNISHLGPFPQSELIHHYHKGSVFCLASLEEGLAMVIPQAMACGLPVICTENTGGRDIVRDGVDGFIVPIRNIDILTQRLLELYHDKELRKKMSRNAISRVTSDFSWADYARRAEKIYEYVLNNKRK